MKSTLQSLPSVLLPGTLFSLMFAAALMLCGVGSGMTAQGQATGRIAFQTRTAAALPAAVDAGPIPAAQGMTVTLTLTPSAAKQAALTQMLTDLQTPASANFHQWLTPAQFASNFGADAAQVSAATTWAQSQGLTATLAPSGQRLVITGTAGQVQTAFAVSLHSYQVASAAYFAATITPSLPASAAALFSAIDGLDNLPGGSLKASYQSAQGPVSGAAMSFADLAAIVDQNATTVLALDTSLASPDSASQAQLTEYQALYQQAAAQGITVLATRGATSGAFPASFAEVTEVALAGDPAETAVSALARPAWQVAPGLPADTLRHAPDLEAASLAALAQTFSSIASSGRVGNANRALYTLGPVAGLYTQPDAEAAGTWEPATGLGLVNLTVLAQAYPRGTGMSSTSLTISNYVPVHGQGTSFTSNVTSGTGGATPTGTVSFIANGVTIATVALSNGAATYSTNQLAGGQYTVAAQYSGDSTYAPSTNPSPASIYVSPEASNLGVQVSGGAVIGSNFTVIVTDSAPSGVGVPSGSVTVTLPVNGAVYTGTLAQSGASSSTATVSVVPPAVGTITLSVNCTASLSYSCSNPYTTTVTVAKATPTLTISYSPNPPVSGQQITLNATVQAVGSAPTPTGNVVFSDNGTTLNAGALNSGTTTTTGTVPTSNTHAITATYQGDANYNSVSTTAGSTTSGAISTTLGLSSSASTVTAGQNITFTAILSPSSTGSSQPTGTVQFFDNGTTLLGTASLSQNVATFTTATLSAAANHSVTAIYSGDAIYTGSTSPAVTVGKTATTVATTLSLSSSAASYTPGVALNLVATIKPASTSSTGPSGSVQFFDGGTSLGSAAVSSSTATFSATFTSGTHTITSTYSGDTNYGSSTSSALTLNKSTATTPSTTTLSVSPSSVAQGGTLTLSAIVTPTVNNTAPTGTVQFFNGTTQVCSVQLAGSTASCTYTAATIGTQSFTANYQGDANYSTSTSAAVSATVTAPPATLTASISPATAAGGATATVSATLVAQNGTVPAGQITATILGVTGAVYNATLPGTANTSTVTVQIPIVAPATAGTYNVVVSCAGTNFSCTSVTVPFASTGGGTAGKIATTTVLTPNPTILPTSGAEVLTATVMAASTVTTAPTGTVSFFDGTTLLGTGNLALVGTAYQAMINTVLTATTGHTLTAVYAGDTNYATSTSTAVTLGTTAGTGTSPLAAITLTASQTTGLAGTNITFTANLTGLTAAGSSPTGTVTFYLAGTTPAALATVTLQAAGVGLSQATFISSGIMAGNSTVYAVYSGDTNFTTVRSNSVSLGLDSFNVTFVPQALTITAGQSAQSTLILGIVNGFAGTVTFGCVPPPDQLITCSFSQNILTGGGSTILTVNTTAPRAQTTERISFGLAGVLVLLAVLGWSLPGKTSRRLRMPALLMMLLALGLMTGAGCSQGGNKLAAAASGGTPLGTTTVQITAAGSDGVNTVRQNYSLQVTVQ